MAIKKTNSSMCTGYRESNQSKAAFYRPPWGHLNMSSLSMAKPYHLVIWTGIFQDWTLKTTKTALVQKLMRKVEDGAIFVLHDNGDTPEQMKKHLK
ncbi:hypothetical protein AAAC51_09575 [Priestia megaterium]